MLKGFLCMNDNKMKKLKNEMSRFPPLEETTVCAPPQLFSARYRQHPTAPLFDEYLQRRGRDKNRAVMQRK